MVYDPRFLCVYVLRNTKTEAVYVGVTTEPKRRLRQHNGELRGGAARTLRSPHKWQMILVVHGFHLDVADNMYLAYRRGRQFEKALNRPAQHAILRRFKPHVNNLSSKLRLIAALLNSPVWRDRGLSVHFLRDALPVPGFAGRRASVYRNWEARLLRLWPDGRITRTGDDDDAAQVDHAYSDDDSNM